MKKVLLGMSGGVDSSVCAILLKKSGYDVIGATMQLCPKGCGSSSAIQDAKRVCEKLGIPHYVLDCEQDFKEKVIYPFVQAYCEAETPNPCIECNQHIKFDLFYQKAKQLGCDTIATGHYAKIEFSKRYKQFVLVRSKAEEKDQTYFLYRIPEEILPHIIFPLADFKNKEEIRKIAEENGLEIAKKPDSQEICFIPNNDYASFIQIKCNQEFKQGDIVNLKQQVLGKHKGLLSYTIGQRKGLGIAYPEPLYVIELDKKKNQVIVGTQKQLYQKELIVNQLQYLVKDLQGKLVQVQVKIRYRAPLAKATIIPIHEDCAKVIFEEEQRAITPGQSVVFYQGDMVIGGGKIQKRN